MSDIAPTAVPSEVIRPTRLGEWTLLGLLIVVAIENFLIIAILAYLIKWPLAVYPSIALYLGIALWLLIGALVVGILAYLSPLIGTIRVKAGRDGVDAEIEGTK